MTRIEAVASSTPEKTELLRRLQGLNEVHFCIRSDGQLCSQFALKHSPERLQPHVHVAPLNLVRRNACVLRHDFLPGAQAVQQSAHAAFNPQQHGGPQGARRITVYQANPNGVRWETPR